MLPPHIFNTFVPINNPNRPSHFSITKRPVIKMSIHFWWGTKGFLYIKKKLCTDIGIRRKKGEKNRDNYVNLSNLNVVLHKKKSMNKINSSEMKDRILDVKRAFHLNSWRKKENKYKGKSGNFSLTRLGLCRFFSFGIRGSQKVILQLKPKQIVGV